MRSGSVVAPVATTIESGCTGWNQEPQNRADVCDVKRPDFEDWQQQQSQGQLTQNSAEKGESGVNPQPEEIRDLLIPLGITLALGIVVFLQVVFDKQNPTR
jgi:hypothetical protein